MRHQFLDQSPIQLFISGIQNLLQKVIGLFQFIPEEQKALAQFKFFEVVPTHDGHAEDIRGGEEPAAATAALVGDWGAFERDLDVKRLCVGDGGGTLTQDRFGVGIGEGGEGEAILCI